MTNEKVETLRVNYGPSKKKRIAKRLLYRFMPSKRWARFEEFDAMHIRYSSRSIVDDDLDEAGYQLFVIGSDQVWNPSFSFLGEAEYLPQITDKKKVSYAASFGVSKVVDNRERIGSLINELMLISVREEVARSLVTELAKRESILVVDPTMLLPIEDWLKVAKRPNMEIPDNGFILKYVLGENIPDEKCYAVAGDHNCKIIDLKNKALPVGPAEFVWLINHATFVCTDSFHASVFSILSHTPFAIFERVSSNEDMSSRFDTLCNEFALEGRRVCLLEEGAASAELDWECVDTRLNNRRKTSRDFLEACLRGARLK